MWIWLITLLKGFLPIDGKRVGKIIWVLALSAITIGVYHKVFISRAEHNIIQTQIVNQCPEDAKVVGLRFNIWRLKLSLGL